jgi:hypothetical protein
MEGTMNRGLVANFGWIVGTCGLLWLAGAGIASAAVPELDPGSAASGIALAIGAALLLAERYRRRQ